MSSLAKETLRRTHLVANAAHDVYLQIFPGDADMLMRDTSFLMSIVGRRKIGAKIKGFLAPFAGLKVALFRGLLNTVGVCLLRPYGENTL